MVWFANPAGGTILKNMRDLGMDIPVVAPLSMATQPLVEVAGEAAEGVVVQAQLAADEPQERSQAFVDAYTKEYSESPETFDAVGHDLVMILAEALKNVDDASDPAQVRDALESVSYEGAGTVVHYSEAEHEPDAEAIVMTEVKGGKFVQSAG